MSEPSGLLLGEQGGAGLGDDPDHLLWRPQDTQSHHLTRLRNLINSKHGLQLEDYAALHRWSCDQYPLFWAEVWDYCGILSSVRAASTVQPGSSPTPQVPTWFPGARLNYAENLLRHPDLGRTALYVRVC